MNDNANAGNGGNNNQNNGGQGGGANPPVDPNKGGKGNDAGNDKGNQKNQNNQGTPAFDPAKISDADFAKVFDDPRTFQHSRFSELNELAKYGKTAKEADEKRKQDEAVKKGEFDKVLSEKDQKIADLTKAQQTSHINTKLTIAAAKLNAVDVDAVLALVDRSKISIDDKGIVTGLDEALKTLTEGKAYLFGKSGTQRMGTGANPGNQNTDDLKRFKHSQILDPVFYRENEADILASQKAGLIENDL